MRKTRMYILTAMFASLITVMTAYICHIPIGTNGGYVHFGDALIYLAASILPTPFAMLAGAVGGGLADLLTAPVWFIPTVIIKMIIALPFTSKKGNLICPRNVAAVFVSGMVSAAGYAVAEGIMFGNWAIVAGLAGSAVQSFGSGVLFIILGFAADKCKIKNMIMR